MSWYFDHEARFAHVQRYYPFYSLACGAASGAISKTAVAPLERVKILLQLQGMRSSLSSLPSSSSILSLLSHIVRTEGPLALFKGNLANVVRVVPVYSLKFSFNDHFKALIAREGQALRDLSPLQLMTAATAAGIFQITITYPLELIRTRMALAAADAPYSGMIDCAVQAVRKEGPAALYKGIVATWVSGGLYTGLQMTTYQMVKRHLPSYFREAPLSRASASSLPSHPPSTPLQAIPASLFGDRPPTSSLELRRQGELTLGGKLLGGALSGLISQTISYPGDTIRRRMQTNGVGGRERMYTGTWDCCVKVWRNEGWRGYMKGASTNVWRCIPGAALQFALYDTFKALFGIAVD